MIYEQLLMFTGGTKPLHCKTGVEKVNLWEAEVSYCRFHSENDSLLGQIFMED